MKKKIAFLSILILAAVSSYKVYIANEDKMSDLVLENIEALAGELDTIYVTCGSSDGACWKYDGDCFYGEFTGKRCRRTEVTYWYCAKNCN